MSTVLTVTDQQRAARVLADILAVPGLAEASWTVHGGMYPDLRGLLRGVVPAPELLEQIAEYEARLGLGEREVTEHRTCVAVQVSGVVDGVPVTVSAHIYRGSVEEVTA